MYKCDICNKTNINEDKDDVLLYGEWMIKQNVTVHYYCLLLSTNLAQRGVDSSGILGFLLRDIRREAKAAKKRKCAFCKDCGASVVCHNCRIVFHMSCGLENRCIYQFCDEFRSYCETCAPLDAYKRQLLSNPPRNANCDICFRSIAPFLLHNVTYGDCCRKGFAHRSCMRRYALASGYYLRCLWCRDKKFHDTIRLQSVFVPDRDATWERQENAYSELHNRRMRCDQEYCLCANGRNYNRNSWVIQLCTLCAATGTHIKCQLDFKRLANPNEFKCKSCLEVEQRLMIYHNSKQPHKSSGEVGAEHIDSSFYLPKRCHDLSPETDDEFPDQSDEETSTFNASVITVVPSMIGTLNKQLQSNPVTPKLAQLDYANGTVIDLSDSQPSSSQQLACALKTPLLLQSSFTSGNHFYLVVYEYNDQLSDPCTGTCTLRFALDDARIKDRSEEALQRLQLTEEDVWMRDTNRGQYDIIDKYTKN